MQVTITRTWQSRQPGTILALLLIAVVLVGGLVIWNDRSGVEGDAAVPRASVANEASGERWVPPQAQAYLPRAVPPAAGEVTAADFPPQAHAYLPRTMPGLAAERTAADFPPQAQGYLPRDLPGLTADLTAADFPPQAHGYLPRSISDAATATAGCAANSFPPQAQAYLPCQRRSP